MSVVQPAALPLVAPGYDMAEVAVKQLFGDRAAKFRGADQSTKLKLLGVHIASFGDYFASADISIPLTLRDPFRERTPFPYFTLTISPLVRPCV